MGFLLRFHHIFNKNYLFSTALGARLLLVYMPGSITMLLAHVLYNQRRESCKPDKRGRHADGWEGMGEIDLTDEIGAVVEDCSTDIRNL